MRYQVFNEKSSTQPVFTAPWRWLASLYASTVALRFDKCRLVDSKSGETLLDWARGCVVGNSKGKSMPEMATLITGFRMTRERELQQTMLMAHQLHGKGRAPAHTFLMGTTAKGMGSAPDMPQRYVAIQSGDSWEVEDTLVQRTVLDSANQTEAEAKAMARIMNSDSALGGTVVVDAAGHAQLKNED